MEKKTFNNFIPAILLFLFFLQNTFPQEGTDIFPLDIPLTDQEKEWIGEHPVIRVGGPLNFPPFYWTSGTEEAEGICYDYIRILADNLGLELEYAGALPWPEVLDGINDGTIDLLAASAKSAEREEFLAYTEPVISSPLVIFSRNDSPYIGGLEDLNGIKVALIDNGVTIDWLKRDNIHAISHIVSSPQEGLEALSLGEADAYIGNLAAGTYLIGENNLANLKVAAPTDYGYYNLYMAARKDMPELAAILDKGLAAMTAQQKSLIRNYWIAVRYDYGISRSDIIRPVLIVASIASVLLLVSLLWNKRLSREIAERIRTENELKEAVDNITTLEGLLPICSRCKNVRDDKGYWKQLDSYFEEHSDILFSHSLCPDCAEDLYGDEKWFKKNQGK